MGRRAQLFAGEERVPAAAVLYARALDEGAARAGGGPAGAAAGPAVGAAGGPSGGAEVAGPGAAAPPPDAGGAGAGAAGRAATAGGGGGEKAGRAARKADRAARRAARVARRAERKGDRGAEADAGSQPGPEGPGVTEAAAEPSGSPAGAGAAGEQSEGRGEAVKRKRERSAEEVEARLQKKERKRQERARATEEREQRAKEEGKQRKAVGGSAVAAATPVPEPEPAAPAVDVESEAFTGKAVAGTTRSVIREAPKTFSFNFAKGEAAGTGVAGENAGASTGAGGGATAGARPAAPAPSGGPAGEGSDPRRLYIGGLPYWCGEKEIKDLLKKFGNVVSVEPLVFPDSGKFRGIAFVSMGSGRAAKRALELDGSDYEGRFLQVRPCTAKPQAPPRAAGDVSKTPGYNVVYVGNLPWDCDEALLEGFFNGCQVTKVRLHTDRETGAFRGFAHVHFADEEGLDRAVALSGQFLEGREVKVAYAVR